MGTEKQIYWAAGQETSAVSKWKAVGLSALCSSHLDGFLHEPPSTAAPLPASPTLASLTLSPSEVSCTSRDALGMAVREMAGLLIVLCPSPLLCGKKPVKMNIWPRNVVGKGSLLGF